jgi:hypothetical protein
MRAGRREDEKDRVLDREREVERERERERGRERERERGRKSKALGELFRRQAHSVGI